MVSEKNVIVIVTDSLRAQCGQPTFRSYRYTKILTRRWGRKKNVTRYIATPLNDKKKNMRIPNDQGWKRTKQIAIHYRLRTTLEAPQKQNWIGEACFSWSSHAGNAFQLWAWIRPPNHCSFEVLHDGIVLLRKNPLLQIVIDNDVLTTKATSQCQATNRRTKPGVTYRCTSTRNWILIKYSGVPGNS